MADLSIAKTDSGDAVPGVYDPTTNNTTGGVAVPGATFTYTLVATNNGPNFVDGAAIVDNFPAAISSDTWTAVASAGSSVAQISGSGAINTTANLLVGGTITFTVTATIDPAATGELVNTATITTPQGTVNADHFSDANGAVPSTDTITFDSTPGHHHHLRP
jgi:hypothetical protein